MANVVSSGRDPSLGRKIGSGELLDILPVGVYCCDADGYLVQYNQQAADLWGYRPELGEMLFGGAQRLFSLDGGPLPQDQAPTAHVLRTREAVRNAGLVIERPDGSRVSVLVSADPLYDEHGALVGVVNCFRDVTELRRAHQELQRSKDDLEDFFENGAVGLHIVGGDGAVLRANKAELELLGYRADEYIGRQMADFHVDAPVIKDILVRLGRGERLDKYPARLRAKDGSIRHVLITSNAPQLRDGELINTRCFTFDVTHARLAEERTRDGEQRFREMLEALPAAVYTTDARGRITFYNQAAVGLAGRRPELGIDEWCVSWRLYRQDGTFLPHDQCPVAIALKEQRAIRGSELIAERPDGSRVRLVPYPTPLFDKNGSLTGAINVLVDVTERYTAELESARLAAIVASSDDAIISKALDGRITSWNGGATRIFGYDAEDMIGQSIARIIPPDLQGEEKDVLGKIRRGERIEHYETERLTKEGRRVSISLTVSPLRDKSGSLVGVSKVGRDITERKRAEKVQHLLMGELNHRVKNTLANVQSIANQTVRSARSPGDFANSLSGRLQALAQTHTLLTSSSWLGADVLALIRDQLLLGGAEDARVSHSGPSLTLDPQAALHLALILHELATNARKYGALSTPNGRLSIQWTVRTSSGRHLLLQWQERGGPPVTAPARRGFGTTLVEQSSHAYGGMASISFAADGVSCEIRLPLSEGTGPRTGAYIAALPTESTAGTVSPQANIRGRRILVVDDEPLVTMDVVAMLREAGGDIVGPAATVAKAKALIEQAGFDAALLDANLGGHPVDDVAAALTRLNVPFAFLTGYGREDLPEAFRQAPLIGKPFSRHQVLEVLGQLLRQDGTVARLRSRPF